MGADKGMAGLVESSLAAASSLTWHIHQSSTDRQRRPQECTCPLCCLTSPLHKKPGGRHQPAVTCWWHQ